MIYNIFVVHNNKQLQEKEALESTFQKFKTGQDPIGYLMILNKLFLLNQSE